MRFADRHDAGRRIARHLARRGYEDPVVIGLPRGGIPVASEVAARLRAPLDALVIGRLGDPRHPEIPLGALAEDGVRLVDADRVTTLGVTPAQLEGIVTIAADEIGRRVRAYRGDRARVPVEGRTVLLVDDGVATGFTARTAIDVLRDRGAGDVVLAVPVGPVPTVHELRSHADDVLCLYTPHPFTAIRSVYAEFHPVLDATVADVLATHASTADASTGDG
jgi:putative phosphoribosyl transferase